MNSETRYWDTRSRSGDMAYSFVDKGMLFLEFYRIFVRWLGPLHRVCSFHQQVSISKTLRPFKHLTRVRP